MAIVTLIEEKFSQKAEELLSHMIHYTDKEACLGILAETVAILVKGSPSTQKEALNKIKDQIQDALSSMPDFKTFIMDDGCGLVNIVNGSVYILMSEKEVNGASEISLSQALSCRAEGLEACENGDVIAIYLPD